MIKQYFNTKGKRDGCIVAYSPTDIRVHFCDARYVAYNKNYPMQKLQKWQQVPFRHREAVQKFLDRCYRYFKMDIIIEKENMVDEVNKVDEENMADEVNNVIIQIETLFKGIILDNPILQERVNKAQNLLISVRNILEII
jgi:hypothetical protein